MRILFVLVLACLLAYGSPAKADTILITSGGLSSFFGPSFVFGFGLFDASGPDFSADPAAVVITSPLRVGGCLPGESASIGIFTDLPYISQATYKGVTYPIGPQFVDGVPVGSQNAWFIDLQGTLTLPPLTGDQIRSADRPDGHRRELLSRGRATHIYRFGDSGPHPCPHRRPALADHQFRGDSRSRRCNTSPGTGDHAPGRRRPRRGCFA